MATECRQDSLDFGTVESRSVVGAFDGGVISSDAGALLLGATDKAIRLIGRFATCFTDRREAESIEHTTPTLVGQRVVGIALGYEDLNDHDDLRHDPVMAVLAGKLKARRKRCAPVAGKSTLSDGSGGAECIIRQMLNSKFALENSADGADGARVGSSRA
jgi:hypothetical protein